MVTARIARLVLRFWAAAAIVFALGAGASAQSQDVEFFRIGTGSTGGSYYPIGGLIATAISNPPGSRPCDRGGACGPRNLIAVVQATQGSVENVEAIGQGRLEAGLVQADIAYWAYRGQKIFRGKGKQVKKLRAIASLYSEALHLVVRRDAGIKSVADLRGKRVSLGEKESGTRVDAEIVLRAYGVTPRQVKADYSKPGPATDLMRAGKLDAMFLVAGAPASAIAQLAATTPITLVPIKGRHVDRLLKRYPFFARRAIPANVYDGVGVTQTLAVGAQFVVSADMPNDLVYGITKALWHDNARVLFDRGHPEGKNIRLLTALDGIAIPLHPGAAQYYRDIGFLMD
jgi:TRAP transporter TAXI family solute receptor